MAKTKTKTNKTKTDKTKKTVLSTDDRKKMALDFIKANGKITKCEKGILYFGKEIEASSGLLEPNMPRFQFKNMGVYSAKAVKTDCIGEDGKELAKGRFVSIGNLKAQALKLGWKDYLLTEDAWWTTDGNGNLIPDNK